jgi:hypothetical protein
VRILRLAHRLLRLDPADARLLLRAFVALAAVDVRLRLFGFQRVIDSLDSSNAMPAPTDQDLHRARRYAFWLQAAGRHHVVRARCLHQSLALHGWLTAQGLSPDLRIGVRTDNRSLVAHAWVELGGQVVNDRPDAVSAFTPLPRLSPSRDVATVAAKREIVLSAEGAEWF